MNTKSFNFNLKKLNDFAHNFSKNLSVSDIILLQGDFGSGKTTLSRYIIKNIYFLNKLKIPKIITSPSFPIVQIYPLKNFDIYHYDFYRINKISEILEIGFEENIKKNISLIEWPKLIMPLIKNYKKKVIKLSIIDDEHRQLTIS